MKGLGLAGAGLGAAAAAAPVFHDLDEAIASKPGPIHKWPWWVKEMDYDTTTVEIDWSKATRLDARHISQCGWQGQPEAEAPGRDGGDGRSG